MAQTTLFPESYFRNVNAIPCKCDRRDVWVYYETDPIYFEKIITIKCKNCLAQQSGVTRKEVASKWKALQLIM